MSLKIWHPVKCLNINEQTVAFWGKKIDKLRINFKNQDMGFSMICKPVEDTALYLSEICVSVKF